jgi:uncharacterized membrane protein
VDDPTADPVGTDVSRLLTAGTLVVVGLVAIGVALATAAGERPLPQRGAGVHLERIAADVVALRPEGFLGLGLVLTILLPAGRVAVALGAYARSGDRTMVAIAIAVLVVLACSVAIALLTQALG